VGRAVLNTSRRRRASRTASISASAACWTSSNPSSRHVSPLHGPNSSFKRPLAPPRGTPSKRRRLNSTNGTSVFLLSSERSANQSQVVSRSRTSPGHGLNTARLSALSPARSPIRMSSDPVLDGRALPDTAGDELHLGKREVFVFTRQLVHSLPAEPEQLGNLTRSQEVMGHPRILLDAEQVLALLLPLSKRWPRRR
jgi:hypothetical protein